MPWNTPLFILIQGFTYLSFNFSLLLPTSLQLQNGAKAQLPMTEESAAICIQTVYRGFLV